MRAHFSSGILKIWAKLGFGSVPRPPYSHVVQLGDPVLRTKCVAVEKVYLQTPEFKKLLLKMKHAVRRYKCVGVSAPQLGVNLRVFAMTFPQVKDFIGSEHEYKLKQMQPHPYTVWVNPTLKVLDYTKQTFPEGCESMRGFVADVSRYSQIQLSGWNEEGEDKTEELTGWLAHIAQHEVDHLDGRMYLDIAQLPTLSCAFWDRVNHSGGKIHLSYYPNKILSRG